MCSVDSKFAEQISLTIEHVTYFLANDSLEISKFNHLCLKEFPPLISWKNPFQI